MNSIDMANQRNDLWKLIIGNFLRRKLDGVKQSIRDDVLKYKQENLMNVIKDDVMQSYEDDVISPKCDDIIHSNKDDDISSKLDNDINGATATKERPNDMVAKCGKVLSTALDRLIADFRKVFSGF